MVVVISTTLPTMSPLNLSSFSFTYSYLFVISLTLHCTSGVSPVKLLEENTKRRLDKMQSSNLDRTTLTGQTFPA